MHMVDGRWVLVILLEGLILPRGLDLRLKEISLLMVVKAEVRKNRGKRVSLILASRKSIGNIEQRKNLLTANKGIVN